MITKTPAKILIVGCGDIGIRLASRLQSEDFTVAGLRRHPQHLPDFIEPLTCNLNAEAEVQHALAPGYDYLVLTLTPGARDEASYRQAFEYNVQNLLQALRQAEKLPKHVFFVSSTSVYGQNNGEWVNEHAQTAPQKYNGRYVLKAEQQLLNSGFNATVVRFSGIYGPGRERLITKVRRGDWDVFDDHYANLIHADDCAGVLAFLLERCQSQTIVPLYLASDHEPAPYNQVCAWLAQQLRVEKPQATIAASPKASSKRCDSSLLRETGYKFQYPSYREGFTAILNAQ